MAGFRETEKYSEHVSHKTKIAGKSREVRCPRKVDADITLHEHLMFKADQEPTAPAKRVMLSKELSKQPPDRICAVVFHQMVACICFIYFINITQPMK